jgi:hypothetical protein
MADPCEKCERCGRPFGMESLERCYDPGSNVCNAVAAAYQRGLRAGVELAKEHYTYDRAPSYSYSEYQTVNWDDVDAALAEKLGGAANE